MKLVHGQPGKGRARPARRQGVAGAGHIIAQHGGRIASQKNRPRRRDFFRQIASRDGSQDFQMLRGKMVGQLPLPAPSAATWISQPLSSQRPLDEFAPRQLGQLPRDFLFHGAQAA